ncbi:DUF4252 domain-containing protein [Dasania sp. GY-MA-18]|uniref:DUF4252 domain-containing protein n=1 Tax=Dasania phycosphaerae TaxID=2950436 RepID=A0A9J6RL24_9GAMM|nr:MULTISPECIES: DUF4252 domain-containing protein [Dasania]MCR8922273.1 DUF4252 domain-containing protein [Dasania sp. GY-MA-18]MCZ0864701.1 DUF4252 domain-containing protein [Dasania phycosphaerae]MCZ0868429.1 DUF4252 domain-containing protein [Dasania phycosphaerae]
MFSRLYYLVLCSLLLANPALSQNATAGYMDFTQLSQHYGNAKLEVNLNKALIGMASMLAQQQDAELAILLNKLEQVNARVYSLNNNYDNANDLLKQVSDSVQKQQWQNVVSINENKDKVRIFTRSENNKIAGLVVMAISSHIPGGEAYFVNIVGEIDPANVSRVIQSLNINLNNVEQYLSLPYGQ